MHSPQPVFSKEEFARRGDEIYERTVLRQLKPGDEGKYVAVDIQTEAFEIDREELAASDRLLAKHPNAQTWLERVGSRYVRRFGPRGGSPTA
jgi:hypothetical protein